MTREEILKDAYYGKVEVRDGVFVMHRDFLEGNETREWNMTELEYWIDDGERKPYPVQQDTHIDNLIRRGYGINYLSMSKGIIDGYELDTYETYEKAVEEAVDLFNALAESDKKKVTYQIVDCGKAVLTDGIFYEHVITEINQNTIKRKSYEN